MQRKYSVLSVSIMFLIISHAAWIWEGILTMFQVGKFVNRGFMHGFWLPLYGAGSLLLIWVYGKGRSSFGRIFLGSAIMCTAIEYFTAVVLENVFHRKWWDYGFISLNFEGRICLPFIIMFGLAGYFLVRFFAPYLDKKIQKLPYVYQKRICAVFEPLMAADFVFSLFYPNTGYGITF